MLCCQLMAVTLRCILTIGFIVQHEDVAINRAYVSKFGIEIGSVYNCVFTRRRCRRHQPLLI